MANKPKYDQQELLRVYNEQGTYAAAARVIGCVLGTVKRAVHLEQGLCSLCNEPFAPGHTLCEYHLEQSRAESNLLRQRRLAERICQRCGKPCDRDGVHCSACADAINENVQQYQAEAKAKGLCANCRIRPLAPTSTWFCRYCLDKVKERNEQRRKKLMEQGLCTHCGKHPVAQGSKYFCESCRQRNNASRRLANSGTEWAENRRAAFARDSHQCIICGRPTTVGHHLDESGRDENPNHSVDNIASLCTKCHTKVTVTLELLKSDNLETVLDILCASPKNNLREFV